MIECAETEDETHKRTVKWVDGLRFIIPILSRLPEDTRLVLIESGQTKIGIHVSSVLEWAKWAQRRHCLLPEMFLGHQPCMDSYS